MTKRVWLISISVLFLVLIAASSPTLKAPISNQGIWACTDRLRICNDWCRGSTLIWHPLLLA